MEVINKKQNMLSTDSILSNDGTKIGYYQQGSGPGLILIHGALSSAENYARLAELLAKDFTVYNVDRRGRGLSGPQGMNYSLKKDVEDINKLQATMGAVYLFGHSFGGLVALETALQNTAIRKIAVYDPAVSIGGSISTAWMPAYKKYLSEGRALDAFTVFSKGTGPQAAKKVPHWLMKVLLTLFIKKPKRMQMYSLLKESLAEHEQVAKKDNTYLNYKQLGADLLFLMGEKSDLDYIEKASQMLQAAVPSMELKILPGLNHFGPDRTGPESVAVALKDFLLRE
ncbi:alpha/beta hydrolase [Mucilaginibacter sp.]|uniref:alpha/beta fold hydrolase n=1 Tax=Mucilaginibacter sp. TaxID=1882438 RepID=UPI002636C825|nr:alpha/beta hydrolase [Mucilaginibacter sp.]MDB4923544.1 alpha/beta hydrolase [Mucilaginibacter sp.]